MDTNTLKVKMIANITFVLPLFKHLNSVTLDHLKIEKDKEYFCSLICEELNESERAKVLGEHKYTVQFDNSFYAYCYEKYFKCIKL
jgi:hypothetical protein